MKDPRILLVCALASLVIGCGTLAGIKTDTGVVIARRAQIRSSVAVVAADLMEVSRGDVIDILDSDTAENGEKWLLVRAHDTDNTEGWIEARNVMPQDVLDKARKLGDEDKEIPPQASGQLRASSNLRLTPDRSIKDNILMKLESGSSFEIVGWKRVLKPKETEATESDDAPKAGSVQQNSGKGVKDADAEKEPEEAYELWYKVRLSPIVSPAPAGWVYGKQVELSVPSDIIFYRTGREFVAWRRLDDDTVNATNAAKNKDAAKEEKPGSWVILEKSSSNEPRGPDEPDFDRIYVLGYDKYRQEHYTAYRSPDVKGYLPLRVEGQGESKTFSVRIAGDDGQPKEAKYSVYKDDRGILKVSSPSDAQRDRKRK
ncbi:MAG TPA: hypothetical protein VJT09_01025 [Pyrinomonadaceae bacterium]|nr:hypothetical protein [Pyrinomonadaceae bacterium]